MPTDGQTIKSLLDVARQGIEAFESQKFKELEAELKPLYDKRPAQLADYEKQYEGLKTRWDEHLVQILRLFPQIKAIGQPTTDNAWDCIKSAKACRHALHERIRSAQGKLKGELESRFDEAFEKYAAEKDNFKILNANAQELAKRQAELDKWIKAISDLVPGSEPDEAYAIYLFWKKLVPAHYAMRPDGCDVNIAHQELSNSLHSPKSADDGSSPRRAPWLVSPDCYEDELDKACVAAFKTARDREAVARKAFDDAKAQLAKDTKDLKELTDKFDARIEQCLKAGGSFDCPVSSTAH